MSRCAGIVGTIFGAVFVAMGCSPAPLPSAAGVSSPAQSQPTRTALIDRGPFLYIGGSKISMYRLGSTKPMRTVSSSLGANVFALDSAGELLVGSGSISWGALTVYDARTLGLIRTDAGIDGTSALAVDAQDYVYDATCGGAITVFTPGVSKIVGEIRRGAGSVCSLGFDGSGALYAANVGARSVSVLVSTGRPGKWRLERRIRQGTKYPQHILVEPSGRLFVANNDSVSVYAPGSSSPERVIRNGIESATAVAVIPRAGSTLQAVRLRTSEASCRAGSAFMRRVRLGRFERSPMAWTSHPRLPSIQTTSCTLPTRMVMR
jgi:hypothetical protein